MLDSGVLVKSLSKMLKHWLFHHNVQYKEKEIKMAAHFIPASTIYYFIKISLAVPVSL